MPTLTIEVELTDEEYANALSLLPAERERAVRPAVASVFAVAKNVPHETEHPAPFPYFDGNEVVTAEGRRPVRPWDGVTKWDGATTNPDDFPDLPEMTAEQAAEMAAGALEERNGTAPPSRDLREVMREMRECIVQGKPLPTRERAKALREQAGRNGK